MPPKPSSPESFKNRKEMPPWVISIQTAYRICKNVSIVAERDLGEFPGTPYLGAYEGAILENFDKRIRQTLYDFLEEFKADLPEIVLIRRQSSNQRHLQVNNTSLASEEQHTKYLLPKTKESYDVDGIYDPENESEDPTQKYFPESQNFLGIESIRNKEYSSTETNRNISFRNIENERVLGCTLEIGEIDEFVKNLLDLVDKDLKIAVTNLKVEIEKLKKDKDLSYSETLQRYTADAKKRFFNLVDSIKENYHTRKLPKRLDLGIPVDLKYKKWAFLFSDERKVVGVPKIKRIRWYGGEVEDYDFDLAEEIEEEYYLRIYGGLVDFLSQDVRDMVKNTS